MRFRSQLWRSCRSSCQDAQVPKSGSRMGSRSGPNYCTPPATTAEHWIDADNPRLKSLEIDNAHWWTAFNDPALDYLVASAADENLTLKTAGCRILEARAERGVAEGNLFPQQQGISGSYSRNAMGNGYPFNHYPVAALLTTTGRPASTRRGNWISGDDSAEPSRRPMPTSMPNARTTTMFWCFCKPKSPRTTSKCGPTKNVSNSPKET